MKFVMEWHVRLSASDDGGTVKMADSLLHAFSGWTPPDGLTVHEIMSRVDGQGGFVVVETADEATLTYVVTQFQPWFDWGVFPVQDAVVHGESVAAGNAWAKEAIS